MKKLLSLCLLFCIVSVLILSSGCENADVPPDDSSSDVLPENTAWKPGFDEPWNFTPACDRAIIDEADYDIEFTIAQTVYTGAPEYITYTIRNKTGKTFYGCDNIYIEKSCGNEAVPIETTPGGAIPEGYIHYSPVWVRLPFYTHPILCDSYYPEITRTAEIEKLMKEQYEFSRGFYRVSVYLADGPHYAYFEIVE